MIMMILTGCVDVSNNGTPTSNGQNEKEETTLKPEIKEGEEVIKIGYSGPLSGPGAQYGMNVLNGMKMAANEINETGIEVNGKTYKIELVALMTDICPLKQPLTSSDDFGR